MHHNYASDTVYYMLNQMLFLVEYVLPKIACDGKCGQAEEGFGEASGSSSPLHVLQPLAKAELLRERKVTQPNTDSYS